MREYQEDFYRISATVRDPVLRAKKAEKIRVALERWSEIELTDAVVLDVGCSSGLVTAALSSVFAGTIGVDYDRTALQAASAEDGERLLFARGDALFLPIAGRSIDLVVCAQTYEHVPDAARMFREIHRVLRPGGLVFFSGPNWLFPIEPHYHLPFLHWLPTKLADFYLHMSGKGTRYYERSFHYWHLRRLLDGFEIEPITLRVLKDVRLGADSSLMGCVAWLDRRMRGLVEPFVPNFNWFLRKHDA